MTYVLYELAGKDDHKFSPYCWHSRMALAHKGLAFESRATGFTDIPGVCGGQHKTVPILEMGEKSICDSWAIADYLEETYPDRPALFSGPEGRNFAAFVFDWTNKVLFPQIAPCVMLDIHDQLYPRDQAYFRESREARIGKTLEAFQEGRDERIEKFGSHLGPLRQALENSPFLCGEKPMYADYVAFGAFQWARTSSPFKLLRENDSVSAWFERCLDLHNGEGRNAPAFY